MLKVYHFLCLVARISPLPLACVADWLGLTPDIILLCFMSIYAAMPREGLMGLQRLASALPRPGSGSESSPDPETLKPTSAKAVSRASVRPQPCWPAPRCHCAISCKTLQARAGLATHAEAVADIFTSTAQAEDFIKFITLPDQAPEALYATALSPMTESPLQNPTLFTMHTSSAF